MNEKEIIKDLKNFIALAQKEENFIYYSEYKFDNELAERVQGILDLYKQEKARNKDLEQIEKEHKEENGRLRDRIKELEKEKKILRHGLEENTEEIDMLNGIIDLMAEQLTTPVHNKKWVIDYFTNKVAEDK